MYCTVMTLYVVDVSWCVMMFYMDYGRSMAHLRSPEDQDNGSPIASRSRWRSAANRGDQTWSYMVYIWIIYGLYMVNIWFIYGFNNIWIIYGLSLDNLWIIYGYGWWLSQPSEKYEFVNGDDDIPNWMENKTYSKPPSR